MKSAWFAIFHTCRKGQKVIGEASHRMIDLIINIINFRRSWSLKIIHSTHINWQLAPPISEIILIKIKEQKLKFAECKPFKEALNFCFLCLKLKWNNETAFWGNSEWNHRAKCARKAENFCTDGLPWNLPNSPNTQELWERFFCQ